MKYFTAFLILIAFLAVGVFGITFMNHTDNHHMDDGGCLATLLDSVVCPQDLLANVTHHMSVFQAFSTAVFSNGMLALAVVLLLMGALAYIVIIRSLFDVQNFLALRQRLRFVREPVLFRSQELVRWLSLFENSPSVI